MKRLILAFMFLILTSAVTAQTESNWHTLVTESSSVVIAVEGAKEIDVSMAKTLHDQGVKFVDVRRARKWKRGHIPSAFSLRYPSEATLMEIVGKNEDVVFYCNCGGYPGCNLSPNASAKAVTGSIKMSTTSRMLTPGVRQGICLKNLNESGGIDALRI